MPHTPHDRYERARRLMPWGTQTNAKRPDPELLDVLPLFIEEGQGCRIRDTEGRWFIDYRSSLGPIILGHRHPAVDAAVRAQLDRGVLFSMASPLELEVAERLVRLVPGLDQVRFMKTGNDANSAAVRLARAHTGRDYLVTCGYHGFGDWFACGRGAEPMLPRESNGVPIFLDEYVTRLAYGDVDALEAIFADRSTEIAALIMVPYDWGEDVAKAFVRRARTLTEEHGAVLIFDQVLTGFRLALGGAQEYFGVVPDLTTYAKALANGYPLSAFGGKREIMERLDQAVITTTYAGETLSLAAAGATLDVLTEEHIVDHLERMGQRLQAGFVGLTTALGAPARMYGLPQAPQVRFSDDPDAEASAQRAFTRALLERGIFYTPLLLLNAAHGEPEIDETLEAMREALPAAMHAMAAAMR